MKAIDNDFSLSDTRIIQGTYFEETIFIEDIEIKRLHIREKMEDESKTLKFIPYWSWGNRDDGAVLMWCKTNDGI